MRIARSENASRNRTANRTDSRAARSADCRSQKGAAASSERSPADRSDTAVGWIARTEVNFAVVHVHTTTHTLIELIRAIARIDSSRIVVVGIPAVAVSVAAGDS